MGELIAGGADLYEVDLLTAAEHILDRGYISEHIEEEVGDYYMFAAAIASARIKGDEDRATQSSAPNEVERLRAVLQWIADTAYVDHQSGNENFEHLQCIARDALSWGEPT
jgi:hypothetical protein